MQRSAIKNVLLAMVVVSALPLAACSDDNDTPTSPTQPGPPVSTPDPAPAPAPTPTPEPTPTPAPEPAPVVTVTGNIANLARSGADGLDVSFRIDDFTIVHASGSTPVISGSATTNTSALTENMSVSVEGSRTNGTLNATRITIASF
jgi:PBP1b-binding outer membrane lipoprotein LpoB